MWAVAVQLNMTQQLKSTHFQSPQNLTFNFFVYGALKNVFLCTHAIIVPSKKLTLKLNKFFIAKVLISVQHITLSDDERDIHPAVHSRNRYKFCSDRDGQ